MRSRARLLWGAAAVAAAALAAAGAAYLLPGADNGDRAEPPAGVGVPVFALPAPTAEMESGVFDERGPAPSPVPRPVTSPRPSARPDRPRAQKPEPRPAETPRPSTGSAQPQGGQAAGGVPVSGPAPPLQPQEGTSAEREPARATAPAAPPPSIAATEQGPAPAAAPSPTGRPMLAPPVPVSLPPPRHPDATRVIVEAPGLVAAARPEAPTARVRLRLLVTEEGGVGRVEVVASSGRPELDAAAADAARSWRFLPARRDGVAIASHALIWVAFVVEP